ncbi:MAG TPA: beta-propeller fold lactonase family protein [Bradyrhizobium sp.]|uniref:lactonase family protein n=1 Tax=Bradyrhizobium sp. TaxID=376 RepID=UPI002C02DBD9|nr:beta-propeller fold lactonase family protein [Bradyrhizobium sp.]HTB00022.1 beta-propeller fold lactonase family protein [Bradyrhizobium sp.]
MIDRRTFTTLLVGGIAAPQASLAGDTKAIDVFYAAVGPELTLYSVDADEATLVRRDTVSAPANIQYAWPHPSKQYLYVVSSNGGSGSSGIRGDKHFASAFRIDPASGALTPHGAPLALHTRPIHASVDKTGGYLLTAYNDPSGLTVHRINADGTFGDRVDQPDALDTGKYAHQIRVTPDNRQVILVTRGNNAPGDNPVNPGSIKTFSFKDGVLGNLAAIQPADGMQFGPRHLDFHPTEPWVYVSVESQNKLHVYRRDPATGLSREPMFIKETLSDPSSKLRQAAGPIHVHPDGRFVYLTNRAFWLTEVEGKKVFAGGENSVAVFAIDQATGEPTLIQNVDGHANYLRTFGIDSRGRLLVTASVWPMPVREGTDIGVVPAAISMFRIGGDGKLEFVRKYDVEASTERQQFWAGMVTLA